MPKDTSSTVSLRASHEVLQLIAEIAEFKGRWEALKTLSPERLRAVRHVAGVKLTDRQIETLLANWLKAA